MKNITIKTIFSVLLTAAVLIAACTKDDTDVRLDPKMATSQVLNFGSDSATVVGFVVAEGDGFLQKGVCYNVQANPKASLNAISYAGSDTGATFKVVLRNLHYATKYYARAYAILFSNHDTIYGDELTFTTKPILPTVTTAAFTVDKTKASGGGNVTNDGGDAVTARGVVYGVNPNPTLSDSKTSDGTGAGAFTSNLSGLKGLTTYHVRAYATNIVGTAYGPEITFDTPLTLFTLYVVGKFQNWDPANPKDSLKNTLDNAVAQGYAYISPVGEGFKFTMQKGWTGTNYGAGTAAGTISETGGNITVPSDGYYFFNVDVTNKTYTAMKTTWGVIGSATAGGWNSDQAMTYSTSLRRWFATIPLTAGEFKFRANGNWDDLDYGDTGNDKKLDAKGANIPITNAGTYSVMMNLSSPLNYTYALTTWSIIGDAAAGWSTDVDMTPNSNNTWTVTTTLNPGEFKFRANHDWPINLGGTTDNLSFGGGNIKITTAGTYTITLDLVNGKCTIQ